MLLRRFVGAVQDHAAHPPVALGRRPQPQAIAPVEQGDGSGIVGVALESLVAALRLTGAEGEPDLGRARDRDADDDAGQQQRGESADDVARASPASGVETGADRGAETGEGGSGPFDRLRDRGARLRDRSGRGPFDRLRDRSGRGMAITLLT